MSSIEPKVGSQDEPAAKDPSLDSSRRDAIEKIGKFAAYTAPAMLAVLTSEAKAAGGSPSPG